MKVQPINYRYAEIEVPDLVKDMFHEAICNEKCPDKDETTQDCGRYTYHDCLRDFISDNLGYYLEDVQNKLTLERWALFLVEWYRASKIDGGHFLSCFNDIAIGNKTYRSTWFSWTKDLETSGTGYMVFYEIKTNNG